MSPLDAALVLRTNVPLIVFANAKTGLNRSDHVLLKRVARRRGSAMLSRGESINMHERHRPKDRNGCQQPGTGWQTWI